jgi:hypothetical protein
VPACLAQWAQQYIAPPASNPWPTMWHPQCAQTGAMAWMAHSKESKVIVFPSLVIRMGLS